MPLLTDFIWRSKYDPDDGSLVAQFYLNALSCAQRYDRTTGYFSATVLAVAARGIEGLVLNAGRMRMVVGCTLGPKEVQAIEQGASLKDTVQGMLMTMPLIVRRKIAVAISIVRLETSGGPLGSFSCITRTFSSVGVRGRGAPAPQAGLAPLS